MTRRPLHFPLQILELLQEEVVAGWTPRVHAALHDGAVAGRLARDRSSTEIRSPADAVSRRQATARAWQCWPNRGRRSYGRPRRGHRLDEDESCPQANHHIQQKTGTRTGNTYSLYFRRRMHVLTQ
jgi:hypothetical protein